MGRFRLWFKSIHMGLESLSFLAQLFIWDERI